MAAAPVPRADALCAVVRLRDEGAPVRAMERAREQAEMLERSHREDERAFRAWFVPRLVLMLAFAALALWVAGVVL